MNRIIDWQRRTRLQKRHRRVELLGGHPGQEPTIVIERFEPDLSKDGRVKGIRDKVAQLGATSFDEATGNALESFIAHESDDWRHRLDRQHRHYKTRARESLGKAKAVAWQYRQLLDEDLMRLQHAETAIETAVLALSGQEPDEIDGRAQILTLVPERTAEPGPELALDAGPDSSGDQSRPLEKLDDAPILQAPRMSRSELRRLLDPQDARRVPRWGEPGFRDGTLLAGRPHSTFVHVLALTLAAAADVGGFTQTVQLVLPQSGWVALLVVIGLTAVVLYIAHSVGVMLREARAASSRSADGSQRTGRRIGRALAALGCTLVWLGIGGLAFWVRWTVPLPVPPQVGCGQTIGSGPGSGCASAASGNSHPLQAAAIFLGLYLATGTVAAVGAYLTHNPYRGGYMSAIKAYRKGSERASASVYRFGLARAAYMRQQEEISASDQMLTDAQAENAAFTAELGEIALIEIASLLKDPAVTDAFFPGR
ncbi:MAG: hypothetical protein ACRDNZ_24665 [Streptosporangiaceae bacterium]